MEALEEQDPKKRQELLDKIAKAKEDQV